MSAIPQRVSNWNDKMNNDRVVLFIFRTVFVCNYSEENRAENISTAQHSKLSRVEGCSPLHNAFYESMSNAMHRFFNRWWFDLCFCSRSIYYCASVRIQGGAPPPTADRPQTTTLTHRCSQNGLSLSINYNNLRIIRTFIIYLLLCGSVSWSWSLQVIN